MLLDYIIRLAFSTIEFTVAILLAFSLFRIPFTFRWGQIVLVSLAISSIYLFQTEIVNLSQYSFVTQILCYIICFILIFNLPFFYAILVSMIGYIAFGVIQISLYALFGLIHINYEMIQSSTFYISTLQILESIIAGLIIIWLQYRKIGFMFVANRVHFIHKTRKYNFFLTATILMAIILMQLLPKFNKYDNIIYIFCGLTFLCILGLVITYRKNKKELNEKYERLKHTNESIQ